MIDTHTHLYMADSFPDGGKAAVGRAVQKGVGMMVLPAVDRESVAPMLELHRECPENTAVALGLHPTEVEADWRDELREILERGEDIDIVAIGETGIDLYWEKRYISRQMDSFGEQIQIALERELPVIVHSRDAFPETAEVIRNFSKLPPIVFHSFTAGKREMELLLDAAPNAFFGINGVVTFKNARELKEAVREMEADRIVTETDSPYLSPVPFRGQTNESANIPYIIKSIAEIREDSEAHIAELTHANALRLYSKIKT